MEFIILLEPKRSSARLLCDTSDYFRHRGDCDWSGCFSSHIVNCWEGRKNF